MQLCRELHRSFAAKNAAQDDKSFCATPTLLNLYHTGRCVGSDLRYARRDVSRKFKDRPLACGEFSPSSTTGVPPSPDLRTSGSSLPMFPRNDTPNRSAIFSARAAREDVHFVLAVRAGEVAHVLNHADDVNFHLAKHFNRLARILQRNVGRRRDHNRAGQRHGLHQRKRNVARTRRCGTCRR